MFYDLYLRTGGFSNIWLRHKRKQTFSCILKRLFTRVRSNLRSVALHIGGPCLYSGEVEVFSTLYLFSVRSQPGEANRAATCKWRTAFILYPQHNHTSFIYTWKILQDHKSAKNTLGRNGGDKIFVQILDHLNLNSDFRPQSKPGVHNYLPWTINRWWHILHNVYCHNMG